MKKLICLGDSTLQYNDASTFPQVGWPQALAPHLKEDVKLLNFAKNGRSTKSFQDEGRFAEAIKEVDENSVVIIEFGHNDEHTYDLTQYTRADYEYHDNLTYMVNECKKKGAYVLLITPIYRRQFQEDGTLNPDCHKGYREAMLRVAEETKTDVIDMTMLTKKKLEEVGEADSREFFMNFDAGIYENYPEGKNDNTHLRQKGAEMITELFLNEVKDNRKFEELLNV